MKRKLKRNDDYLAQRRKLLWMVDGCWRLRLRRELLLLLLIAHGVVQGRINWGRDAGCVVHSWSCYFVQRWCCSAESHQCGEVGCWYYDVTTVRLRRWSCCCCCWMLSWRERTSTVCWTKRMKILHLLLVSRTQLTPVLGDNNVAAHG